MQLILEKTIEKGSFACNKHRLDRGKQHTTTTCIFFSSSLELLTNIEHSDAAK